MPQLNPKTGKQLSGSAKRKAAAKRAAAYQTAAAKIAAAPAVAQTTSAQLPGSADFAAMSAAPIGNPAEAIAWVNDVMLVALGQVIRDPALDGNNLERWKQIQNFGKALGYLKDKAAEQARIRKLAEQSGMTAGTAPGAPPAGGKPLAGISKPKTARGT